jgi:hypothetical protein
MTWNIYKEGGTGWRILEMHNRYETYNDVFYAAKKCERALSIGIDGDC